MSGPRALAVLALALSLAPYASFAEAKAPARLSDAGPMAWLIEDGDASIYVLGTIHVGTNAPKPFDERCMEVFRESDALIAELSAADYGRLALATAMLIADSLLPASESLEGRLSATCRSAALALLGERTYGIALQYRPWVLYAVMINAAIDETGLTRDSGMDARLYALAGERWVEGLDSLEDQLALVAEGTDEEQIASLEAEAPKFLDGSFIEETMALAAAYDAGDRSEVERLVVTSIAEGSSPDRPSAEELDEFLYERNATWARRLAAALEAGGKYFVFAGAAHFLGPGSVFDEMRALGAIE
jgi:uncharacterized protein